MFEFAGESFTMWSPCVLAAAATAAELNISLYRVKQENCKYDTLQFL